MELHQSRLASTEKLRQEWDRRLDRNSISIDVLNSNRAIWLAAGGAEPDSLATPTEVSLEHCNQVVKVLHLMLKKYGPRGGLDSHVSEIEEAVKRMRIVTWDAIRKDKYSLTPKALYDQMATNAQRILTSWTGESVRRQTRLTAPTTEATEEVGTVESSEDIPLRPRDILG